jgi:hypothetical protein
MRATKTALAGILAIPAMPAVVVPAEARAAEIEVSVSQSEPVSGEQLLSSCGTSTVTLFSGPNYTGTYVSYSAAGAWQSLVSDGLNNTVESWVNQTTCQQLLADTTNGGGDWFPMAANSKSGSMGSWANRAGSVFVG